MNCAPLNSWPASERELKDEAITRVTPDAVCIGHTREHVAGAPRDDPELMHSELEYFFNLFPYCGYAPSFGLIPSTVGDPIVKSETNETNGSGERPPEPIG
jgi:hypothetical protein